MAKRRYKRAKNGQFAGGSGGGSGGSKRARVGKTLVKARNGARAKMQPRALTKREASATIAAGAVLGAVRIGRQYGPAGLTVGAISGASGAIVAVNRHNSKFVASSRVSAKQGG